MNSTRFLRTPEGDINNCALANGDSEANCQICGGRCPDRERLMEASVQKDGCVAKYMKAMAEARVPAFNAGAGDSGVRVHIRIQLSPTVAEEQEIVCRFSAASAIMAMCDLQRMRGVDCREELLQGFVRALQEDVGVAVAKMGEVLVREAIRQEIEHPNTLGGIPVGTGLTPVRMWSSLSEEIGFEVDREVLGLPTDREGR